MTIGYIALPRSLQGALAVALSLAAASCSQLPPSTAAVAVPPVPAGEARVWIYRVAGPYDSQARPYVRMNDAVVGILEPRGAFYRDVAPGHYHVAIDQAGGDFNTTKDIDLARGQQVYFKIVSAENWITSGGSGDQGDLGMSRPTFYVWSIPPEVAQGDVARSPYFGGS
jgi:hypothetical protein